MTHRYMTTFTIRDDRIRDHTEVVGDMAQQEADAVAITGGDAADVTNSSVEIGIVAAGTGAGDAEPVTKQTVVVATAAASTGIIIPAAAVGMGMTIFNQGANTLAVYPATGDQINGGASITVATLKSVVLKAVDGTDWYSVAGA